MAQVSLEDLDPRLRGEVEEASSKFGLSKWSVVADGKLELDESLERLERRIESLKDRAEKMNERYRAEMRVGDNSDPGFHESGLLFVARHLESLHDDLSKLSA